jgi:hypothetical protein
MLILMNLSHLYGGGKYACEMKQYSADQVQPSFRDSGVNDIEKESSTGVNLGDCRGYHWQLAIAVIVRCGRLSGSSAMLRGDPLAVDTGNWG